MFWQWAAAVGIVLSMVGLCTEHNTTNWISLVLAILAAIYPENLIIQILSVGLAMF